MIDPDQNGHFVWPRSGQCREWLCEWSENGAFFLVVCQRSENGTVNVVVSKQQTFPASSPQRRRRLQEHEDQKHLYHALLRCYTGKPTNKPLLISHASCNCVKATQVVLLLTYAMSHHDVQLCTTWDSRLSHGCNSLLGSYCESGENCISYWLGTAVLHICLCNSSSATIRTRNRQDIELFFIAFGAMERSTTTFVKVKTTSLGERTQLLNNKHYDNKQEFQTLLLLGCDVTYSVDVSCTIRNIDKWTVTKHVHRILKELCIHTTPLLLLSFLIKNEPSDFLCWYIFNSNRGSLYT